METITPQGFIDLAKDIAKSLSVCSFADTLFYLSELQLENPLLYVVVRQFVFDL